MIRRPPGPKTFQPYLFLRRGRTWTIISAGVDGRKKQKATKFKGPQMKRQAEQLLAIAVQKWKAGALIEGDAETGPMTVARWANEWLRTREIKGLSTVDDYRSILVRRVLPHIGHLRLDRVTPEHVTEVMRFAAEADIAPRTQRHVYGTMKTMFSRAIPRLLAANPCCIHSDELPQKKDADPEWRPTAIFTRAEVQTLITSALLPEDRRVVYAVMFLTGMRFGEISALRVRHYLPDMEPLGQLQVGLSYNSRKRKVKGVKTDRPRTVPVHPWLAQILGRWLALGWPEREGRAPAPDDILIPTNRGTHRHVADGWAQFQTDLDRVGLRRRRVHDSRRTFISFARADGAIKDRLRVFTHGPEGDVMDTYTETPWASLCEEMLKLKMGPPPAAPPGLVPNAANSLGQGCHQGCHCKNCQRLQEDEMYTQAGPRPGHSVRTGDATDTQEAKAAAVLRHPGSARQGEAASEGQSWPMATLATLALRQALAALRKGRVDQATEIIERAVAEEAAEARRVDGGAR